ncbi:MAG: Ger(x)C family spore germination protein [Tumebacillaceae bacterium]
MRKRRRSLLLLLVVSMLMSGCLRTTILEQTGLIVVVGYDGIGKNQVRSTVVLHQMDPRAKETTQVLAGTAHTSKGSRVSSNLEVSKKVVSGQLRVALYNEKLAKDKGIFDLVDTLSRDATVGRMIYLGITRGDAMDLLAKRYREISNIGTYLYQDIKQNVQSGSVPSPTLHEFIHDFYDPGKDYVMPILQKIGDKVTIVGVALMKTDRMVGEATNRESYFIKSVRDRFNPGDYEVGVQGNLVKKFLKKKEVPDQVYFVISTLDEKNKIKLVDPAKRLFDVQIDIKAEMLEASDQIDLTQPESAKAIELGMSVTMTKELEQLIRKLQAVQCDALGFGEVYRSSVRNSKLTPESWHEMFKNVKIKSHVNVTLVRSGIVE